MQSYGWLCVSFPAMCDLREDPARPPPTPTSDNPEIMLQTLGHLQLLPHLITTPLKVFSF